jgi:hypothetical protein
MRCLRGWEFRTSTPRPRLSSDWFPGQHLQRRNSTCTTALFLRFRRCHLVYTMERGIGLARNTKAYCCVWSGAARMKLPAVRLTTASCG